MSNIFVKLLSITGGRIARGSIGSMAMQIVEAGLGFLTSIVLARILGVHEFGVYGFAISFAGFLTVPALLGQNILAVKESSRMRSTRRWSALRGFVFDTRVRVAKSSLFVAFAGGAILLWSDSFLDPAIRSAAFVALVLIPINAMFRFHEGVLRGVDKVLMAQVPGRVLRPAAFLIASILFGWVLLPEMLGNDAIILNVAATSLGFAAILILWLKLMPSELRNCEEKFGYLDGYRKAMPFALMAGLSVVNVQADIIMLGALSTPEDVGIYRAASGVASLIGFAMIAVSAPLSPRFSSMYATQQLDELQSLVSKGGIAITLLALPLSLFMFFRGDWVLMLFGDDFVVGDNALGILSVGLLVQSMLGLSGVLLSMSGHEKLVAKVLAISAVVNLTLNLVLIPRFGASGAAVATSSSYIIWSVMMAIYVRHHLDINPGVLGILRRKEPK